VEIDSANNTLGGIVAGEQNIISGNGSNGVQISGNNVVVQGNFVGTDVTGAAAVADGVVGNGGDGIVVFGISDTIGGTSAAARNVISGNTGNGVHITGDVVANAVVEGNFIGTNAAGNAALPNGGDGVLADLGTNHIIGGQMAGAQNLISGNGLNGVEISANGNQVLGNLIGTDASGALALGNSSDGILLSGSNNVTGGATAAARNVISANRANGVDITGSGATGNQVQGNFIGTAANGTSALPNSQSGVFITNGDANNTVGGNGNGLGNTIAFNGAAGVAITDGTASPGTTIGNAILSNSIFANKALGIDLNKDGVTANHATSPTAGPNQFQNFPVLSLVAGKPGTTVIQGTLTSIPSTTFTVQFFADNGDPSGFGQGQTLLGSTMVTTDTTGSANFNVTLSVTVPAGQVVTATATDNNNNTSEFSADTPVFGLVVTNTNDNGPGSLRAAIQAANALPGTDTITFNIPGIAPQVNPSASNLPAISGNGAHVITPSSALPAITDPVVIDGTSQPGFNGTPLIILNGTNLPVFADGLNITAGNSTVQGLVFAGFGLGTNMIALRGNGSDIVQGNYIGTDFSGNVPHQGNNGTGVFIASSNNTIGGLTAASRNIITGSTFGVVIQSQFAQTGPIVAQGNVVEGNYIGTDVNGTAALGNGTGVQIEGGSSQNTIGGATAAARNIISGNTFVGVFIGASSNNTVEGNYVGTDVTGTVALGNGSANQPGSSHGVAINDSAPAATGGPASGHNLIANNLISGNKGPGVDIESLGTGSFNTVQGNMIGTDVTGTKPLGNSADGVLIVGNDNNTIGGPLGSGNTIAFNGGAGVDVKSSPTNLSPGNAILGNSIFANAKLGIDLGGDGVTLNDSRGHVGPNNFQNFPILTKASFDPFGTVVQGTLHSTPNTTFTIQFFGNAQADPSGFGQGQTFLGQVSATTDGSGNAGFGDAVQGTQPGGFISATATDSANNTSEFSQDIVVAQPAGNLAVIGVAFHAKEGIPITNAVVATFTDSGVVLPASNYKAVIDFGDGTAPVAGTVVSTASASTFNVLGSHTYAAEETYPVTVTVSDTTGRSSHETTNVQVGGYVTSLYSNVLSRNPDRNGLDSWVKQLHAGTLNREQVAFGFWVSAEHRGLEVDQFYTVFLGRNADPSGRAHWVQMYLSGGSDSDVVLGIVTSTEFTASHPDSNSFVVAMYVDILGRTPGAAEAAVWQGFLDQGSRSRSEVAFGILSSVEAIRDAIDQIYVEFLKRHPDAAGAAFWFGLAVTGQVTPTTLNADILASAEYLELALS
jgi:hypothetical protein